MCTFAHVLVMMFVLSLQSYQKGLTPQTGASPIFYFSRLACACIHVHARDEVLADNNNKISIEKNKEKKKKYCVLLDFLRLPGAMIVTDYLLQESIQSRIDANTIRIKSYFKWHHKIK